MAENNLFAECIVSIIPSKEFSQQYIDELKKTLVDNGAGVLELGTDGKVRLEGVTHIISTTSDFPQYRAACEQMIPVVVPEWIKSSLLRNRQAQLRPFTPDPKLFFSGVIVCCADLPDNDKDAIVGGVLAMGGQESSNLTKLVTHIVALTVDNAKIQQAVEKKLKCKFVLPHWFDDCLKLGRRIDEGPYLLPDPEILSKSAIDPVQYPSSASVQGAMSSRPEDLPQPPDVVDGSRHRLSVFKKKKVMLSADLGLSGRLRKIIEDLLEGGGGTITTTILNADIYVCHYREGKDYIMASQTGKDVGNLSWLYYLIIHNEWTSPFRRLLHYPIPRQGIPGFKDFRISLSNYWGDARLYLENLVIAAGAEYTKNMKVDNTHLITARKSSEKCEAAVEWNINMVNHLWIEESYAKCEMQSLSNPRYTHFPPRTNLGEVIGQTQFDPTILEKLYFPEDSEDLEDPEEGSSQARVAMRVKDQNAPVARKLESDPVALSNTPTAKKRGRQSRVISHTVTPSNNRLIGHDKENETPSSTSSRGAKDRALSKLHDLAPDVALYEKEKKRGGGVWGGKRAADRIERESSRKRFSSPTGDENNSSDDGSPEVKRPRTGLPPIRMRLLITGYKRWLGSVDVERAEKKKLRELGILVTQDPTICDYLAAPAIVRTQKFLCALAAGAPILSSHFVDTCIDGGEIPPVEKFLLKDTVNEKRFKLKLKDVIRRAKASAHKLLDDIAICCTPDIVNGHETYKAIAEANGAKFYLYRGRGGFVLQKSAGEEADLESIYLISGTKPEEKKLWPRFEKMASDGGLQPRIVVADWLLDSAMSQEIKWNDSYLVARD